MLLIKVISLAFSIICFFVVLFLMIYYCRIKKVKLLSIVIKHPNNSFTLLINLMMISLMIYSISVSYEIFNRQLIVSKEDTLCQIEALRNSTREHINKIEEFEKKSKEALLVALILEYKENIRNMNEIVSKEAEYVDETKSSVPNNKFSFEAYQANLNNATIDSATLLDKIVQIYNYFKLSQSFMDLAKTSNISNEARVENLRRAINMMKDNRDLFKKILIEMAEYREKTYNSIQHR